MIYQLKYAIADLLSKSVYKSIQLAVRVSRAVLSRYELYLEEATVMRAKIIGTGQYQSG